MAHPHHALHDKDAERLRGQIFSGDLTPGPWPYRLQLCAAWCISRTPLRAALQMLSLEGLVRYRPRRVVGCHH